MSMLFKLKKGKGAAAVSRNTFRYYNGKMDFGKGTAIDKNLEVLYLENTPPGFMD